MTTEKRNSLAGRVRETLRCVFRYGMTRRNSRRILARYNLMRDDRFQYMLLHRMRSDCEFYLGYGNRDAGYALWAKDERKHIRIMMALWASFPLTKKPQWISFRQIEEYGKQLLQPGKKNEGHPDFPEEREEFIIK